ncbi:MAG: class I SAM-dependent methyltransferase [Thermodesulfobacteriota bacterium]
MLQDTGERIIPPKAGEVSYLFNRHKMAYLFANGLTKENVVLDAGCGTGYGSKILANNANKVYAIDYSYDAVNFAKQNYSHLKVSHIVMDVNSMGFDNNAFDLIVSFQVIEHMKSLDIYLEELIRILKDDGTIIISTPNVQSKQKSTDNKFHFNELTYEEANQLFELYFDHVEFCGTHYRQKNFLRTFIQKSFLYQVVGRKIPRKNIIKKVAKSTLRLDDFIVSKDNIEKAMDLIIVARHPKKKFKQLRGE